MKQKTELEKEIHKIIINFPVRSPERQVKEILEIIEREKKKK